MRCHDSEQFIFVELTENRSANGTKENMRMLIRILDQHRSVQTGNGAFVEKMVREQKANAF
jgi:hypothetical protein